jgi:hypothetical protein
MNKPRSHSPARKAQVLLIAVLVVGTVILVVAVGMAKKGIAELSAGLDARQSLRASALADGCANEALLRLSRNHSYQGGTMQLWDGSCVVTVSGSLNHQTIDVSATVNTWTRKLTVRADASGGHTQILDWKQDPR